MVKIKQQWSFHYYQREVAD